MVSILHQFHNNQQIKLMYKQPTKSEKLAMCREYYLNEIQTLKPTAFNLNVSLTSNPFLKDRDGFRYLKFQLNEYNKKVEKGEASDEYETASCQKLHSMLSDLAQIETREDQLKVLEEITAWFKEQRRLINQRKDQGVVRYEVIKQLRHLSDYKRDKPHQAQKEDDLQIPTEIIFRLMEPYRNHNRTTHKELDLPIRRLNEYKRKIINIAPFIEVKDEVKPPRVLYLKPVIIREVKEEQPEPPKEGEQGQPPLVQVQLNQKGEPIIDGEKKDEPPEQPQQDLGGFGEEPEQPAEDQQPAEEAGDDKLAPKNKIYTDAIREDNEKKYKQPYLFYMGYENPAERNMELKYVKKQEDNLRKQKEDQMNLEIAHDWAKKKSKMAKQLQKKLQEMKLKPQYIYSTEEPPKEERLSAQDQLKFGFTTAVRSKTRKNEFDLNVTELPRIGYKSFHEKEIRRDRLNSLKHKFGKMLNISDQQSRQSQPSLCQYSSRRRGLSQIIRNHSHSKERLHQLEEVSRIKEKLTRVKIGVNIKILSKGLCLPENQEQQDNIFPLKDLPSNPALIEVKKKKKK